MTLHHSKICTQKVIDLTVDCGLIHVIMQICNDGGGYKHMYIYLFISWGFFPVEISIPCFWLGLALQ